MRILAFQSRIGKDGRGLFKILPGAEEAPRRAFGGELISRIIQTQTAALNGVKLSTAGYLALKIVTL